MDERQQKGLVIAATKKITQKGATYLVPAQSRTGRYAVDMATRRCSCPDHELTGRDCKHIYSVEFYLERETSIAPDGTKTVKETTGVRLTYTQSWSSYNAAQTTEKDHFCRLLRDLVAPIPSPQQTGKGQRRLPLADMLFSAAFKVYSGFSGRRFMTDMRAAELHGHVAKAPCYNSIFNVIESEEVTPIIKALIETSALPLASVESDFAVDSTGIGTSRTFNYYSHRYKQEQKGHAWLKLHAIVGTKTNIIAAAEVTERDQHDSPQFVPLVEKTADNFTIGAVTADKAYCGIRNQEVVIASGGIPFIPFKERHHGHGPNPLWNRLFHYFEFNRDEFLAHYHRRSNVEATFSALKRVFGDSVRSKTPTAQRNEALLKALCHNIRVLIHEMHDLGVTPVFEKMVCPTEAAPVESAQRELAL